MTHSHEDTKRVIHCSERRDGVSWEEEGKGGGVGRVEGGVGVVQWGSRVGVLPKRLCVYMWICIVWPCREREQSEGVREGGRESVREQQ